MAPYVRSTPFFQVKQQNELGRAFNGHLADHHQLLRLAPFVWKTILDTKVLIAQDLGAVPAPLVLALVEC
jgi:hypothetical protein